MFKINSIESIVIVLLKAKTMKMRFKETLDLLKDALNLLEYHKIEEIDKLTKQGS
jgi:D-alanyl-D-alanine carboxypeptidase